MYPGWKPISFREYKKLKDKRLDLDSTRRSLLKPLNEEMIEINTKIEAVRLRIYGTTTTSIKIKSEVKCTQ